MNILKMSESQVKHNVSLKMAHKRVKTNGKRKARSKEPITILQGDKS